MAGKIEGKVVAIGDSGNLITDIGADQLESVPRDDQVAVRCDDHLTNGIFDSGHSEPASTLLAVIGKSGQLELEIVGDSAKIMLGVAVGEKVTITW